MRLATRHIPVATVLALAVVDAGRRSLALAQPRSGAHQRDVLGPDVLREPAAVAWTPDGEIVVRDPGAGQLVRTDVSGTVKATWPLLDGRDGRFVSEGPTDVALTADGGLVVADEPAYSLQRFAADGTFVARWPMSVDGEGQWHYQPAAVATAPDGTTYAVTRSDSGRVVRFDSAGQVVGGWPLATETDADRPVDIAVEPDGSVAVLMGDPDRVQRYTADGRPLNRWPLTPVGSAEASGAAVSVTPDGELLVLQPQGAQGRGAVVTYSSDGHVLRVWNVAPASWYGYCDLSAAVDGSVYVVCDSVPGPTILTHYNGLGTLLETHSVAADCAGSFRTWQVDEAFRVAAGPGGRLAIASRGDRCVQVYGPTALDAWRAEYFADRWLTERPLAIHQISGDRLDVAWGDAGPAPPLVPPHGFSARFERDITLAQPGGLAIAVAAAGGVRLWVDDALVVDAPTALTAHWSGTVAASRGRHRVRVEYSDTGEAASLAVRVEAGPAPRPTATPGVAPLPGAAYLPLVWSGPGG